MQRFVRFNELTIFNPTIPTEDCVSLRVHRTSQKIPWKDLQKEMNEEFELITVTISLAATAMNENNGREDKTWTRGGPFPIALSTF